jgi:hypothetical protein
MMARRDSLEKSAPVRFRATRVAKVGMSDISDKKAA